MATEFYEHLMIGGEYHSEVVMSERRYSIELMEKPKPQRTVSDICSVTEPVWEDSFFYEVHEWRHMNGKRYYIGVLRDEDLERYDIDKLINESKVKPIR